MKKALRVVDTEVETGNFGVSVSSVNNPDASGELTVITYPDSPDSEYIFVPTVKALNIAKNFTYYYIRFLRLNNTYTEFFKTIISFQGGFANGVVGFSLSTSKELIMNEISSISNSSNYSDDVNYAIKSITRYSVNRFELYSYPDQKLIYPL
jgi:hypothetical protein